MIKELGRRGLNGRREAGAFLLVRHDKGDGPVVRVVYYDDLDPNCLVGEYPHSISWLFKALGNLRSRRTPSPSGCPHPSGCFGRAKRYRS